MKSKIVTCVHVAAVGACRGGYAWFFRVFARSRGFDAPVSVRSNLNKCRPESSPPKLAHAGDEDNGNVAHAGDEDKENGDGFAAAWTSDHAGHNLPRIRKYLLAKAKGQQKKVSEEHADLALEKLLKAGRYFEYVGGPNRIADFKIKIHNEAIHKMWPKLRIDSPPTAAKLLRKIISDETLMNQLPS